MSLFGKKSKSESGVVGAGKGMSPGQPALVHKEAGGAMVLLRASIVDAMSASMASKGVGLSLEAGVATLAGGFAGIGTERGLVLYKSGNATVKHLRSGRDALSGADLSDWDVPCYLVMFRGC